MSNSVVKIVLAERALDDLATIEDYSKKRWGEAVAERYLDQFETAFELISRSPGILREEPLFAPYLHFYQVGKHLLVCDRIESTVYVLTIVHASIDLPSRLADFEPSLKSEAELLHKRLQKLNETEGS